MMELTFVEYLIDMEVLTYEQFKSDYFRWFLFEGYYNSYKLYCKENDLKVEKINFNL